MRAIPVSSLSTVTDIPSSSGSKSSSSGGGGGGNGGRSPPALTGPPNECVPSPAPLPAAPQGGAATAPGLPAPSRCDSPACEAPPGGTGPLTAAAAVDRESDGEASGGGPGACCRGAWCPCDNWPGDAGPGDGGWPLGAGGADDGPGPRAGDGSSRPPV